VIAASAAAAVYATLFWNGIPVWFGPSASAKEIEAGRDLFEHEWTVNDPRAHGDGVGPIFNATSCVACHFQGGVGGGGENRHNAVAFEISPRPGDPVFHHGTIHNYSRDPAHQESLAKLNQLYPVVASQVIAPGTQHCGPTVTPDFDPVRIDQVQPTSLFGAGWIDLISERAITQNRMSRLRKQTLKELQLDFDQIPVGRSRVLEDGSIGKFGWKSQHSSLAAFVNAACANELGLGTPETPQANYVGDTPTPVKADLDKKQVRALVSFVKTLPRPVEADTSAISERGKALFKTAGCSVCHVPDMGGVSGVYSDFLLYSLDEPPQNPGGFPGRGGSYGGEPPPQLNLPQRPDDEPKPSEWRTPPLWGVADSAPYLHDGRAATLHDAILDHKGDAKLALKAYQQLSGDDQAALVAFLKTLKAPTDAPPVRDMALTKLAPRN
jgi:mono/diheme cytochrome c family protein